MFGRTEKTSNFKPFFGREEGFPGILAFQFSHGKFAAWEQGGHLHNSESFSEKKTKWPQTDWLIHRSGFPFLGVHSQFQGET